MKMSDPADCLLMTGQAAHVIYIYSYSEKSGGFSSLEYIFSAAQLFLRWYSQVSNLIWSGSGVEGHRAKLNQIRPAAC